MSGAFENSGHKYAAVMQSRFFTGLYTNRNPLSDPGTPYLYKNYAPRYESLIDGNNVEITNRLTLARRPGTSLYNSSTFSAINSFYSFRQFSSTTETITVIADTATAVYDVTGPANNTSLFTKSALAGPSSFQSVGNVLYFGNGIDQEKFFLNAGVPTTQLWGIAAGSGGGGVTKNAGLGTNGSGGLNWTNPNNVTSAVSYATNTFTASAPAHAFTVQDTNPLKATTFGYAESLDNTIQGVQISFEGHTAANFTGINCTFIAQLLKGGVPTGNPKVVTVGVGSTSFTLGGASDLWGTTLSANDVNQTTWGVQITGEASVDGGPSGVSHSLTFSVRHVVAIVYAIGGPNVNVNAAAGSMSAVNGGYVYKFAYGNSLVAPAPISSSSPASSRTGNFASKLGVDVVLVASTDPQVNQIHVYRTTDNGSLFFEIPTSPYANSSGTITDGAPDAQLNIEIQAPTQTSNNPPPAGLIALTYHLGRIWGAVNNTVYYSGGPDTLTGNGNEAFPPKNFFIFPSSVTRLFPTANGIFVFTLSDVYFIGGTTNNPANGTVFFSVPFIHGLGLSAWPALDVQGSVLYMLSTDGQFLSLDPNSGVSEIGVPIGDKLSAFNPALAYVAVHNGGSRDKAVYAADGSTGWYRLNPTPAPESGFTWSPFATITGGVKCVQSVEVSPGVRALLLGPTSSGPILQRDLTVSQDNGANYTAFATIGSLVLAQPGGLALLDFITTDALAIGSHPAISVLIDEISGGFTNLPNHVADPQQLPASTTVYGDRFYFAQTGLPAVCRHMQITVSWPAEGAANELLTFTIFGTHYNEKG